jgi:hypothetical protein
MKTVGGTVWAGRSGPAYGAPRFEVKICHSGPCAVKSTPVVTRWGGREAMAAGSKVVGLKIAATDRTSP